LYIKHSFKKYSFSGIAHQKFEQLNELNDSDYSISDESDSDSSIHTNLKTVQPEETQISLRRSLRKKDVPFVCIFCKLYLHICFYFYNVGIF